MKVDLDIQKINSIFDDIEYSHALEDFSINLRNIIVKNLLKDTNENSCKTRKDA